MRTQFYSGAGNIEFTQTSGVADKNDRIAICSTSTIFADVLPQQRMLL